MTEENAKKDVCCTNSKEDAPEKLKVLAIHGYRQNGEVFRAKTGSFRKLVHKYAQFTYITAPHKVIPVDDMKTLNEIDIQQSPEGEQYGWFFNRDDRTFRGIRKGGPAIGFEESVKFIEETVEKYGPFDGVLGFSQGGCFTGLLCDMQVKGLAKTNFKFAVIAAGFKSDSLPHKKYYDQPLDIPSLHIYGENDNIIPNEMSKDLCSVFEPGEPVVVMHPGGHFLPASSQQKHDYQKFFKAQLVQKQYGHLEAADG